AQQQESAVGEDVAVDHPLEALLREAQVGLDRRQRDVEDRRVEDVHELDEPEQEQDKYSAARREGRLGPRLTAVWNCGIGLCGHSSCLLRAAPGGRISRFR